jgi:hypothetical protein
MDITPYVENLRRDLAVAADAGGEEALMLLDALSAAADEITRELAPGSVELRLRAGEPEFAVTPAAGDGQGSDYAQPLAPAQADEGATARINLRLPEQLKADVEQAAGRERMSVNAWLVRSAAAALAHDDRGRRPRAEGGRIGQAYTGWAR